MSAAAGKTTARRNELSLATVVKNTTPAEASVHMCVRGDLFAKHQTLDEQLERAIEEAAGAKTINDPKTVRQKKLAQEILDLEAEMEKYAYDFTFRRVDSAMWSELKGQHLPQENNQHHLRMGVNVDTFSKLAVQASCVSPTGMDATATFDPWWAELSEGQRDRLFYEGAWAANRERGEIPKSVIASSVIHSSKQKSGSASG